MCQLLNFSLRVFGCTLGFSWWMVFVKDMLVFRFDGFDSVCGLWFLFDTVLVVCLTGWF